MTKHCASTCGACTSEIASKRMYAAKQRTVGGAASRLRWSARLPSDDDTGPREDTLKARHSLQTMHTNGFENGEENGSSLADLDASVRRHARMLSQHDFPYHSSSAGGVVRSVGLTSSYEALEAFRIAAPPPPPGAAWEWASVNEDDNNEPNVTKDVLLHYSLPSGVGSTFHETKAGKVCKSEDIVQQQVGSRFDAGVLPAETNNTTGDEGFHACEMHRAQATQCIRLCGVCSAPACLTEAVPADVVSASTWRRAWTMVCAGQCLEPLCSRALSRTPSLS